MLWKDGAACDLNSFLVSALTDTGWSIRDANDINDSGWIAGDLFNSRTGEQHAYVLPPVPEPSTYAFLFAGGAFLVWRRSNCRKRTEIAAPDAEHDVTPTLGDQSDAAKVNDGPGEACSVGAGPNRPPPLGLKP